MGEYKDKYYKIKTTEDLFQVILIGALIYWTSTAYICWISTVYLFLDFNGCISVIPAADPGGRQRSAVHHQGVQVLQLLRGEDRPLGEVAERRVRDRRPDHDGAKKVDVPGVHLHGQRGHLQAASSRVRHLHGGTYDMICTTLYLNIMTFFLPTFNKNGPYIWRQRGIWMDPCYD